MWKDALLWGELTPGLSISPSVYVVYTNISATNDCTSTIGKTYGTTNLSYTPSDLHSMEYNFVLNGTTGVSVIGKKWNTINYADLISNCTRLPFHNPSWSNGNEAWQNWMYTLKHCYPPLQDSPALGLVDPAWAKCDDQIAMYDPPRALLLGKALDPAPPAPTPKHGRSSDCCCCRRCSSIPSCETYSYADPASK